VIETKAINYNVAPWDARAIELEPIHGPYAVYDAWCEWFDAWNEKRSENMQLDIDDVDKTALFSAFQSAIGETAVASARRNDVEAVGGG